MECPHERQEKGGTGQEGKAGTEGTWLQDKECLQPQKLQEAGGTLPWSRGGSEALPTPRIGTWNLQDRAGAHSCGSSRLVCGSLSQGPQDTYPHGSPTQGRWDHLPCPGEMRPRWGGLRRRRPLSPAHSPCVLASSWQSPALGTSADAGHPSQDGTAPAGREGTTHLHTCLRTEQLPRSLPAPGAGGCC